MHHKKWGCEVIMSGMPEMHTLSPGMHTLARSAYIYTGWQSACHTCNLPFICTANHMFGRISWILSLLSSFLWGQVSPAVSQYVYFTSSRLAYAGGLVGSTSDYRPKDIPVLLSLGVSGILSVDFSCQQHSKGLYK